jgi:hypothetical protein
MLHDDNILVKYMGFLLLVLHNKREKKFTLFSFFLYEQCKKLIKISTQF